MYHTTPLAAFSASASFHALEFFRSFRRLDIVAHRIKFIVSVDPTCGEVSRM